MPSDAGTKKEDGNKTNSPTTKLDHTLSDLYRHYYPSIADKKIGHIFCGTTSTAAVSDAFVQNKKYIYQDSAFNDADREHKSNYDVQKALAPKYLSMIPQRDAFIAGDAPVIFFHASTDQTEIEHGRVEAERTLSVLGEKQKPEVIFLAGPNDVGKAVEKHGIHSLTSKLVLDQISASEDIRWLTHPDTQWYLNSKEALSRSGLPTPSSVLVDVEGYCPPSADCCDVCKDLVSEHNPIIPKSCTGRRNRWLHEQEWRILNAVRTQALPFVFKNQQAFSGAGNYVIVSETERTELVETLTTGGTLRRALSLVSVKNEHLKPGTVLLTKMVENPMADYGLTFFASESGGAVFLAASEQMIDRENASWIGSTISYPHQEDFRVKFGDLLDQIAAFLHKHSYFGPGGVDILETHSGSYQIVDLNIRTSGSLCLPLLKTHFTSRGYQSAASLSITARESRDQFCDQWREEMSRGQLCILAWYEDEHAGKIFGDVAVGAEDEASLAELLEKVKEATEQVTF